MIGDTGGERIVEYFALVDEGDMMFSDEVVVKDRVGVRFSEKGVGSEGGRRDRETAISDNKFERFDHFHLTVEFLLKTESGYLRDAEVT